MQWRQHTLIFNLRIQPCVEEEGGKLEGTASIVWAILSTIPLSEHMDRGEGPIREINIEIVIKTLTECLKGELGMIKVYDVRNYLCGAFWLQVAETKFKLP